LNDSLQICLVFKKRFKAFIFLEYTQWQCILSFDNSIAMYQDLKTKTYTLAGFEPGIFCSGGGHDATPPGLFCIF
jgi:hypothetical protein